MPNIIFNGVQQSNKCSLSVDQDLKINEDGINNFFTVFHV